MKTKVANLLVLLLIIMGNATIGCKSNENCVGECACMENEQKRTVCFRKPSYIKRLQNCDDLCTQEQCNCDLYSAFFSKEARQKPNPKCDCVPEREPLGLCFRGKDKVCKYGDVKCQCESDDCRTCRAFRTCEQCEKKAFNASVIECPGPLANPTRKNPVQPTPQSNPASSTTSSQTVTIKSSPVPANTNRGGSGNKVGTIVGSVVGALAVIAVIVFGVYWKWGNRNRVY